MRVVPESKEVTRARFLEKSEQFDEAALAWLAAGEPDEAARVLITAKRYKEAGHILLRDLGIPPGDASKLDAAKKKRAKRAALCLWRGGDLRRACQLLIELDELTSAAKILEELGDKAGVQRLRDEIRAQGLSGDPADFRPAPSGRADPAATAPVQAHARFDDAVAEEQAGRLAEAYAIFYRLREWFHAARMAAALGRHAEAAQLLEGIGLFYEAAVCHRSAGNERGVLDALKRVSPAHPQYRRACQIAIQIAAKYGALDSAILQFVKPFCGSGPTGDSDAEAFYTLGASAEQHGLFDVAYSVFVPLARALPDYRDCVERAASAGTELRRRRGDAASPSHSGEFETHRQAQVTEGWAGESPSESISMYGGPRSGPIRVSSPGEAGPPRPPAAAQRPTLTPGELTVGDVIAGRYHIEALLGRGGMATVYQAHDAELECAIAMKIFDHRIEEPQLLARFKQEVMLSRQLAHPNIVRLYDFGAHAGLRFITMELLTGKELSAFIGVPMDLRRGLSYLVGACAGLEAVHKRGVVHRDLKPANFFITEENALKIMDFGIAKQQGSGDGMTVAGFFAGTPEYMSPEQIQSFSKVNHLTDIYALGVIAYELFTGACPFTHGDMRSLLMMHMTHTPPPPREINPELPIELESLILNLLEKEPANRVQSCALLGQRLEAILAAAPFAGLRDGP